MPDTQTVTGYCVAVIHTQTSPSGRLECFYSEDQAVGGADLLPTARAACREAAVELAPGTLLAVWALSNTGAVARVATYGPPMAAAPSVMEYQPDGTLMPAAPPAPVLPLVTGPEG